MLLADTCACRAGSPGLQAAPCDAALNPCLCNTARTGSIGRTRRRPPPGMPTRCRERAPASCSSSASCPSQASVAALAENPEADKQNRIEFIHAQVPASAIAEFEAQREENSVGVASFNGRSCGGCFIVLPPADISAIRNAPADELPQCPDCGSYLVRSTGCS